MQRNVIKNTGSEQPESIKATSTVPTPPPRGVQTDHSLRLDRGTPEWADSRTPGSAKALRLEAACHQPADNLVRVWAGCQQKSRTRAGLVALKHEEALMQIHLMLVLLGSKKSPTQTHLLKRKQ